MLLSAFSFLGLALTDFQYPAVAGLGDDAAGLWRGQRAAGLQFRDYGGSAEGESGGRGGRLKPWPMSWAPVSAALFGLILTPATAPLLRCRLAWWRHGAAAASSIGEAVSLSQALPAGVAQALMAAAKAFIQAQPGAGDGGCIASAAGRRDLAQPRHPWRNRGPAL